MVISVVDIPAALAAHLAASGVSTDTLAPVEHRAAV
jgi:hypothetical protein